jgi:O-antigen/teichoic acid export membrane protein
MSLVSLFGALLNISLSIIFAHQWGLFGVAIATAISFFISEVVLNLWLLRRYNDFSIIRPGLKFIVLALTYISIVLIGKLTFELLDPLTWFELIFSAGIIVITLLIFSWYLILAVNMRQQLITMLLKKEKPIQ